MRLVKLLPLFAFCLMVVGCGLIYGPVEEVKTFINEKDEVILQFSQKIEASPTEAGVDEALKIFEGRKGGLKSKRKAISDAPQGFNGDWLTMLAKSRIHDGEMFDLIETKLNGNQAAKTKYAALRKEFNEVVQ